MARGIKKVDQLFVMTMAACLPFDITRHSPMEPSASNAFVLRRRNGKMHILWFQRASARSWVAALYFLHAAIIFFGIYIFTTAHDSDTSLKAALSIELIALSVKLVPQRKEAVDPNISQCRRPPPYIIGEVVMNGVAVIFFSAALTAKLRLGPSLIEFTTIATLLIGFLILFLLKEVALHKE